MEYKSIYLDNQQFCASKHVSSSSATDNSCFISAYTENGTVKQGYGIVKHIFAHSYEGRTKYFILPKWFQQVTNELAVNEITGLRRIKPAPTSWDGQIEVADNLYPISCAFWPSDPFRENARLRNCFDVVEQRNPVYDLQQDE